MHEAGPSLEMLDVGAIGQATRSIDMAAFVLTDIAVIEALEAAGRRGVHVRIYYDRGFFETQGYVAGRRAELSATPKI